MTQSAETYEAQVHCAFDEMVLVEAMQPHPENPNQHPENQVAILAKNIKARGWRHPIIRSELSGFIVAGHARLMAAQVLELESVPVNNQAFKDEADELGFVLADNKIADLAELNFEGVAGILKRLEAEGTDLDLTGFMDYERSPLLEADWEPPDIGDLNPDSGPGKPINLTADQREVFDRAVAALRTEHQDDASEGRIVELLCADYLAGA